MGSGNAGGDPSWIIEPKHVLNVEKCEIGVDEPMIEDPCRGVSNLS
jgi:hypothetical protein